MEIGDLVWTKYPLGEYRNWHFAGIVIDIYFDRHNRFEKAAVVQICEFWDHYKHLAQKDKQGFAEEIPAVGLEIIK